MSSGKERTKKYSERLRENEEMYAMVKNKDSERKNRLFIDKSNSAWSSESQAKEREKKRKQRRNKTDNEKGNQKY